MTIESIDYMCITMMPYIHTGVEEKYYYNNEH